MKIKGFKLFTKIKINNLFKNDSKNNKLMTYTAFNQMLLIY